MSSSTRKSLKIVTEAFTVDSSLTFIYYPYPWVPTGAEMVWLTNNTVTMSMKLRTFSACITHLMLICALLSREIH